MPTTILCRPWLCASSHTHISPQISEATLGCTHKSLPCPSRRSVRVPAPAPALAVRCPLSIPAPPHRQRSHIPSVAALRPLTQSSRRSSRQWHSAPRLRAQGFQRGTLVLPRKTGMHMVRRATISSLIVKASTYFRRCRSYATSRPLRPKHCFAQAASAQSARPSFPSSGFLSARNTKICVHLPWLALC